MTRRLLLVIAALILLAFLLLAGCAGQSRGCAPSSPKVVAFTASWCGPCKQAKPHLARMESAGVEVEIVDIDKHPELARRYGGTSVPTFFVYVYGKKAVRTQDVTVVVALTRRGCK